MSPRAFIVSCTFPEEQLASQAARTLVEEGRVACAQVLQTPVRSIYRWEGKLCEDQETLLLLKTSRAAWEGLQERLSELHPYELPEILASPVEGSEAYLDWVERSCAASAEPK